MRRVATEAHGADVDGEVGVHVRGDAMTSNVHGVVGLMGTVLPCERRSRRAPTGYTTWTSSSMSRIIGTRRLPRTLEVVRSARAPVRRLRQLRVRQEGPDRGERVIWAVLCDVVAGTAVVQDGDV